MMDDDYKKQKGRVNVNTLISKGKTNTIWGMPKIRIICLVIISALTAGCYNPFSNIWDMFGGGGSESEADERPSFLPTRVENPTEKLLLAVGGVAEGRDEIIIYDSNDQPMDLAGATLVCLSDSDIVKVLPRPGFDTEAEGSGVRIVPVSAGVAAITCTLNSEALGSTYEVTVPPQSLVQILFAEARGVMTEEDSRSPTAEALGSVIRNRIWFTNSKDNLELFGVDPDNYDADPPESYYDSIIMAEGQFAPTDPADSNHDAFLDAEQRIFLEGDDIIAYDQAVLTAGGIFNGDIEDNTTGAFAFFTPTADQWTQLAQAWSLYYQILPDGAGVADSDYPGFAPVQVLIHPDVPIGDGGIPAFVFVRMRTDADYAVVKQL